MKNSSKRAPASLFIVLMLVCLVGCSDDTGPDEDTPDTPGQTVQSDPQENGGTDTPKEPPTDPLPPILPPTIPDVVLTERDAEHCKVMVGDAMPEISLPLASSDETKTLADLMGEKLTVVAFWTVDEPTSLEMLADLGPDVLDAYSDAGVAVVAIGVNEPADEVKRGAEQTGAMFPQLVDENAEAFAKVGSELLPRIYLLDGEGKILWFDIVYSRATRRQLQTAIEAALGNGAA